MATQCSDAGTTASGVVIETINGSSLPVANQQANAASSNGYGIIAVLGVGAVEFTNATLTAGTAIAPAVDANADLANSGCFSTWSVQRLTAALTQVWPPASTVRARC